LIQKEKKSNYYMCVFYTSLVSIWLQKKEEEEEEEEDDENS